MEKINLQKTAELMSSHDYKERFIAEYAQLLIRTKRLERVLQSIADNTCPKCFTPSCPVEVLEDQYKYMVYYLAVLSRRAAIEEIELPEVEV